MVGLAFFFSPLNEMFLYSRPDILPGVTHPASVSCCVCSLGNGLHSPRRPCCQRSPPPVPGTGTRRNPPARSARPRPGPAHPPRKRRRRRRHRVPARLRTGKLIAPAGSGERRGLGGALGGPLGPAPSGRLKQGGCPLPSPPPRALRVRAPLPSPPACLIFAVSGPPKYYLQVQWQRVGPSQRHQKYCLLNSHLSLSSSAPLGIIGQTHNKTQK